MPTYAALLYYADDNDWSSPEFADVTASYGEFGQQAGDVITGGAALYPTTTSTTVQVRGGKGGDVVTSDGPYAEAKEVLGGFYLLQCADLDEAVRWAQQIPAAWSGKVELRPVIPLM